MKASVNTAPLQMMYRDEPEALRLADGAAAFADLHEGRSASAKIVLQPHRSRIARAFRTMLTTNSFFALTTARRSLAA